MCFSVVVLLDLLLVVFFKREKKHEVGWVGRGGLGEVGDGNNMMKI